MLRTVLIPTLVVLALAGCASSKIVPADLGATRQTTAGAVLVDSKGMTLYTYDKDAPGQSNCHGMCAMFWPPAKAPDDAQATGDFSVIDRDGGKQWAYKGMPLYGYLKDDAPGDVKGDNVDGVWHVVVP
ncbi:MAG: hypothetical protein D6782_04895 [Alphaproteobacteria bacterium]|nr:MAG: hypothetical protein D6782_04895 [Alphaproteobacteria bacterium]